MLAAVSVLVVLIVAPRLQRPDAERLLRGDAGGPVIAARLESALPDGRLRLAWIAAADVGSFVVELLGADLEALARHNAGRADTLALTPAEIPDRRGSWRVLAYRSGDVVAESGLVVWTE